MLRHSKQTLMLPYCMRIRLQRLWLADMHCHMTVRFFFFWLSRHARDMRNLMLFWHTSTATLVFSRLSIFLPHMYHSICVCITFAVCVYLWCRGECLACPFAFDARAIGHLLIEVWLLSWTWQQCRARCVTWFVLTMHFPCPMHNFWMRPAYRSLDRSNTQINFRFFSFGISLISSWLD